MKNFGEIFLFLIIIKKLSAQNCNIGNFKCGNSCCICYNGYYCNDPSKPPVPCPAGTYSYSKTGNITECTPCSSGYFSGNASSGCNICPNGYQCCDPSKPPVPCPAGSFSYSSTGKIPECTACSLGYFSPNSSWECKICFRGHQCCDPSKPPVPCPAGTYSYSNTGKISECTPCSSGYFSPNSSWECKICFHGHQCCDPSKPPVPCPAGTYSYNSGGNIPQCTACSPGSYTDTEGSTYCKTCLNQCPPQINAEPCNYIPKIEKCNRNVDSENERLKCKPVFIQNILDAFEDGGSCNFYKELEKLKNCGDNGYLLKYGFKYCNKFRENENTFDYQGKLWTNSVRKCLIKKLTNYQEENCDNLKKYAFKTHVDCYLNPGYGAKSFCDIISKDNLIGLWDTYDLWDFFSTDSITQVLVVLKNCASNLFDTYTTNWINLFNIYFNQTMHLIDNLSLFQVLQVLQIPLLDQIFDNIIGKQEK